MMSVGSELRRSSALPTPSSSTAAGLTYTSRPAASFIVTASASACSTSPNCSSASLSSLVRPALSSASATRPASTSAKRRSDSVWRRRDGPNARLSAPITRPRERSGTINAVVRRRSPSSAASPGVLAAAAIGASLLRASPSSERRRVIAASTSGSISGPTRAPIRRRTPLRITSTVTTSPNVGTSRSKTPGTSASWRPCARSATSATPTSSRKRSSATTDPARAAATASATSPPAITSTTAEACCISSPITGTTSATASASAATSSVSPQCPESATTSGGSTSRTATSTSSPAASSSTPSASTAATPATAARENGAGASTERAPPPRQPVSADSSREGCAEVIEERQPVVQARQHEQPMDVRIAAQHGEPHARAVELVQRLDRQAHAARVQERHAAQVEHHQVAPLRPRAQRRLHLAGAEEVEIAARSDNVCALDGSSAHAEGGRLLAHGSTLQARAPAGNRSCAFPRQGQRPFAVLPTRGCSNYR